MGNFKVKVNNEAESREIQNILESIGFRKWDAWSELGSIGGFIWTDSDMTYCDNKIEYFDESPRKEITLPELRAMVRPMKEYLDKQEDGTYKLITASSGCVDRDWIEIPEGAKYYATDSNLGIKKNYFFRCPDDAIWVESQWMRASFSVAGQTALWQRESEAESLVDWSNVINNAQQIFDHENAGNPSLNDQYAEIEQVRQAIKVPDGNDSNHTADAMAYAFMGVGRDKVRQHQHYFIDVSDVDEIDFYEIALRYNVTDPCIQHILKKCLAVGQRGQKDFHHDLKDIYDTAKRMLDVHGLDS